MYLLTVFALMFVGPALSIGSEMVLGHALMSMALLEKWAVFWLVGLRLGVAGIRQIAKPSYTAHTVLGMGNIGPALLFVQELGFANVSMGLAGVVSLWLPLWRTPVACIGGLFFLLAGVKHVRSNFSGPHLTTQAVAMVTDFYAGSALLALAGFDLT